MPNQLVSYVGVIIIDPPYSCRQGICLTCMCQLKEGEVEYIEPPTNEPDEGSVLICISQPKTSKRMSEKLFMLPNASA